MSNGAGFPAARDFSFGGTEVEILNGLTSEEQQGLRGSALAHQMATSRWITTFAQAMDDVDPVGQRMRTTEDTLLPPYHELPGWAQWLARPYKDLPLLGKVPSGGEAVISIVNTLANLLGFGAETVDVGGPVSEDALTYDVTDPFVTPTRELTPEERNIRHTKRFARAIQAGFTSLGTTQVDILRGEMAPPTSTQEQIIDFIGAELPILAATFGVGGPLAGGGEALAARALGTRLLSRFGGETFGRHLLRISEKGLFRNRLLNRIIFGKDFARLAASETGRKMLIDQGERELARQVGGFLGIDLGFAGMFAASDLIGEETVKRAMEGEGLTAGDVLKTVGLYSALGGGLGLLFRAGAPRHVAKLTRQYLGALQAGHTDAVPVGYQVGNKIRVPRGQLAKGQPHSPSGWRQMTADGRVGRPSKAPDLDEVDDFVNAIWEQAMQSTKREEAQVAEAVAEGKIDQPAVVEAVTPRVDKNTQTVYTYAAMYSRTAQRNFVAKGVEKPVAEARIRELLNIAADETLPVGVRQSAMGEAIALQRAYKLPSEMVGKALDTEIAAYTFINDHVGTQEDLLKAIARYGGNEQFATRARILAEGNVPEAYWGEVRKQLGLARGRGTRGVNPASSISDDSGSVVWDAAGNRVLITQKPRFGVSRGYVLDGPAKGQHLTVRLDAATLEPKAGSVARLKDDRLVRVTKVNMKDRTADVAGVYDPKSRGTVKFEDFAELSDSPETAALLKAKKDFAESLFKDAGETAEVPSTEVSVRGEPATLEAVGQEKAVVKTKRGRAKVPKGEIKKSTRNKPKTKAQNEIELGTEKVGSDVVEWVPPTRPDANHRILFMMMPNEEAAALRAAWQSGDVETVVNYLKRYNAHVVPPFQYRDGHSLLGLEVASGDLNSKMYTTGARRIIEKLQDTGGQIAHLREYYSAVKVGENAAEIYRSGRLYNVPDELWAKAQRDIGSFNQLTPQEQTTNLRQMLDLAENMEHPVDAAATVARQTKAAKRATRRSGNAVKHSQTQAVAKDAEKGFVQEKAAQGQADDVQRREETLALFQADEYGDEWYSFGAAAEERQAAEAGLGGLEEAAEQIRYDRAAASGMPIEVEGTGVAGKVKGSGKQRAARIAQVEEQGSWENWEKFLTEQTNETPYILVHKEAPERAFVWRTGPGAWKTEVVDEKGRVAKRLTRSFTNPTDISTWATENGYMPTLFRTRKSAGLWVSSRQSGSHMRMSAEIVPIERSETLPDVYFARISETLEAPKAIRGPGGEILPVKDVRVAKHTATGAGVEVLELGEKDLTVRVARSAKKLGERGRGGGWMSAREGLEYLQSASPKEAPTAARIRGKKLVVPAEEFEAGLPLTETLRMEGRTQVVEALGEVTPEVRQYLVKVFEDGKLLPAGTVVHREVGGAVFASEKEAQQFLSRLDFTYEPGHYVVEGSALGSNNTVAWLAELPAIDDIIARGAGTAARKNALREWEGAVRGLLERHWNVDRMIPPEVREYAEAFGDLWLREFGTNNPAFTPTLRRALNMPTIRDLGPKLSRPQDASEDLVRAYALEAEGKLEADPQWIWHTTGNEQITGKHAGSRQPEFGRFYDGVRYFRSDRPTIRNIEAARNYQRGLDRLAEDMELTTATQFPIDPDAPINFDPLSGARYARDLTSDKGTVVEVLEWPVAGDEAMVRWPGRGTVGKIAKKDLGRPHFGQKWGIDHIAEGKQVDGLPSSEFFDEIAPVGTGDLEVSLGLSGMRDSAVITEAAVERVNSMAPKIKIAKNNFVHIDATDRDFLIEAYSRMQELPPYVKPGTKDTFVHPIEAFEESIPKRLRKPLRYVTYLAERQKFGDHIYAELLARSKARVLTPDQRGMLADWVGELQGSIGAPKRKLTDHEAVQLLIKHEQLDPHAAGIAQGMIEDASMARYLDDAGISTDMLACFSPCRPIRLSDPKRADLGWFSRRMGVAWKVARRHPGTKYFDDATRAAVDMERRSLFQSQQFMYDLYHNGYNKDDILKASKLLKQYNTWGEVEAAGADVAAVSDATRTLKYPFEKFRAQFDADLDDLIRFMLKRNVSPVPFNPNDPKHVRFINDRGWQAENIDKDFMLLPSYAEENYGFRVPRRSRRSEDEIDHFLQLRRAVESVEEMPEGLPEWMYDQFNFWKRWGRTNYWPLVHEGEFAVEYGGKLVAWARSYHDAVEGIRHLVSTKPQRFNVMGEWNVREAMNMPDDIMMRHLDAKKWERTARLAAEHVETGADEIRAFIVRMDPKRLAERMKPGVTVHAWERKMNLEPVFEDPVHEFMVYRARIQRALYKQRVGEALETVLNRDWDAAMASAFEVPGLWDMDMYRDWLWETYRRAIGEYTNADSLADSFMSYWEWLREMSQETVRRTFGKSEVGIPWSDLLNPITGSKYFKKRYLARKRASEIIAFQSNFRLFGSLSSAMANASQFWVNTPSMLIQEGHWSMGRATSESVKAWKDATEVFYKTLWKSGPSLDVAIDKLPSELRPFVEMMDEAGIAMMPGKQSAGADMAGMGDLFNIRPNPLVARSGWSYGAEWTKALGMLPFNGAERINRLSTLIVGYRHGIDKGMSELAAREYAKNLVRETQFLYDDLAMPMLFTNLGPAGRVLLQFKPFVVQQLGFEKDMVVKAFGFGGGKPDLNAMKALAHHFGMYTAWGGLRGVAASPALAAIGLPIYLITGKRPDQYVMGLARGFRKEHTSPQEQFEGGFNFMASDILAYGLPSLTRFSLGQRVGVSGQELLNFWEMPGIFGPHGSIYADLVKLWHEYARQKGTTGTMVGAAVGALAPSFMPQRRVVGGKTVTQFVSNIPPLTRSLSALVGGMIGSGKLADFQLFESNNPFEDFLDQSPEGRNLLRRGMPTVVRNFRRTMEIMTEGSVRDAEFRPHYIPASDRVAQTTAALFGVPTIADDERAAVLGLLFAEAGSHELTKQTLVERIARSLVEGDNQGAWDAMADAHELGIVIQPSSINQQIENITRDYELTIRENLPVELRFADVEQR